MVFALLEWINVFLCLANDCVVTLYVDELFIFGTCINIANYRKCFLAFNSDMKVWMKLMFYLGVTIIRCETGLMLKLEHYVERLFKKFGHHDINPMSTPYDTYT